MKIKTWHPAFLLAALLLTLLINCKKEVSTEEEIPIPPSNGEVYDAVGNKYSTVVIGKQEWFTSNLNTTKYSDGTAIPTVTDLNGISSSNDEWAALTTGAYCWYNNKNNMPIYGAYYNWYAVANSRGLCPTGWHVPSDAEWTTLTTYLGGEGVAGGKLKETGPGHWGAPNTGADNTSGFTAVPGGCRLSDGTFSFIGVFFGFWWSSTEVPNSTVWTRNMSNNYRGVGRSNDSKKYGMSVRCLRD